MENLNEDLQEYGNYLAFTYLFLGEHKLGGISYKVHDMRWWFRINYRFTVTQIRVKRVICGDRINLIEVSKKFAEEYTVEEIKKILLNTIAKCISDYCDHDAQIIYKQLRKAEKQRVLMYY